MVDLIAASGGLNGSRSDPLAEDNLERIVLTLVDARAGTALAPLLGVTSFIRGLLESSLMRCWAGPSSLFPLNLIAQGTYHGTVRALFNIG